MLKNAHKLLDGETEEGIWRGIPFFIGSKKNLLHSKYRLLGI